MLLVRSSSEMDVMRILQTVVGAVLQWQQYCCSVAVICTVETVIYIDGSEVTYFTHVGCSWQHERFLW